jgi:hypothetical protein
MDQETQIQMAEELSNRRGIEEIEHTRDVLKIMINHGEHNSLHSEVLSVIGRYDCTLYTIEESAYQYWLI